jgi:hypothetical protein
MSCTSERLSWQDVGRQRVGESPGSASPRHRSQRPSMGCIGLELNWPAARQGGSSMPPLMEEPGALTRRHPGGRRTFFFW